MRSERPCSVQTPSDGAPTNDESSPSWASCSSTPSFSTGGLNFDFNQKCTVSEESLQFRSSSSDQLSSSEFYLGRSTPSKGPDSAGDASSASPSAAAPTSVTLPIGRFTHLVGQVESVAPPPHAQFLRKPVSKTKSADISCEEPRKKTLAQDVRLRLGFLRRRNTDEKWYIPKWAESFVELTNSKQGLALFRAFLSREFSEENIDFWLAVEEYKKSRPHKLASKARRIYEEFVAVQAPKEVNLEASTRSAIQENLHNVDVHMFDQAQRRIQGLMEQDAYIRFLQCDLYQDLLKQ